MVLCGVCDIDIPDRNEWCAHVTLYHSKPPPGYEPMIFPSSDDEIEVECTCKHKNKGAPKTDSGEGISYGSDYNIPADVSKKYNGEGTSYDSDYNISVDISKKGNSEGTSYDSDYNIPADISKKDNGEGTSYDSDCNLPEELKRGDRNAANTSPGLYQHDSDQSMIAEKTSDNKEQVLCTRISTRRKRRSNYRELSGKVQKKHAPSIKKGVQGRKKKVDEVEMSKKKVPVPLHQMNIPNQSGINQADSFKTSSNGASNPENYRELSGKAQKKQAPSIKKGMRGRKKKVDEVEMSKKKVPVPLHQMNNPNQSGINQADSFKTSSNGASNPEPVLNNIFACSSSSTSNNNPLFFPNSLAGQDSNNSATGTQTTEQPHYILTPLNRGATSSAIPESTKCFTFNSKNILNWLTKHKELCKGIPYPLPQSLFDLILKVHKEIFDHYCTASVSEESSAVLKVYEHLDCQIHKHINSINNTLNVL